MPAVNTTSNMPLGDSPPDNSNAPDTAPVEATMPAVPAVPAPPVKLVSF